ncbi:PopZ family protein [Microvirga sp. 2MCAF35]|uniref:PopZ family protein n=1 Tax=Microvirga sp. 2MCAF35 TaxID=3232987 RepID=UPI003F947B80
MEEILASIRRIISDDDVQDSSEPDEPRSSALNNVLDIAELHVAPLIASGPNEPMLGPWSRGEARVAETPSCEDFREDGHILPEREERVPAPVFARDAHPQVAASQPTMADALISNETSVAVSGAFDRLGATLKPSQPQTVEDLMKEMLRPMLKAWLDDNLPPLVERLVKDEIERVTRRRA